MRQGSRSACSSLFRRSPGSRGLHHAGPVPAGGLRSSGLLPATAQSAVVMRASTRTCTAVLPLSRMLISSSRQQQRYYARAVNDKPYSVRQDDKPRPTTKQPAAERDRGLAGLAQLEASPAVPAGRIAQMLDYALSNSGSPLIIKRVLALIKKVEGKHRNDYALLVSALSKAKDLSDKERMSAAQTLYERMNKLHDNHSARLFDVAIFSTLIKIFAAGGDWARCEALMQHMRDEKIKPTIVTYTNLLKYCERVESWHKAAEVLEQMKTEAPGLKPDVVFYTAMVNVCCKRNDLTQALRVLAEMRNEGVKPNIFTYASLVNICEREKNLKKALDLLEEMKDENIQPNVYIYTSLINVCEKKRDLVTAMKLFDDMTRLYRIRPNTFTFNSLLNVCVEKRDLDRGMEVLALMRQHQVVPNTSTFNSLASLCAKTGNAAKGLELLATMKTTGVSPDNLTFTSLIAACRARDTEGNDAADTDESTGDSTAAQARESAASPPLEQALSLLDRMQREFNVAPDNITLMTLMSVCLRSRRLGYALRAYGQAKAELARNRALQLDKENYYELVNLCAKSGQWRRGLEIVSDMENAGLTPSVRIYNSFLRNFDPTRDLEDAKEVVRMMRSKEVEEDDTTKVLLRRLGIQPRHIGQILQQGASNKRANSAAETKRSSARRNERASTQGSSKGKAQPTTKKEEERRKSK